MWSWCHQPLIIPIQKSKPPLSGRIPVVRRADMLGELMRYRHGIAVAVRMAKLPPRVCLP